MRKKVLTCMFSLLIVCQSLTLTSCKKEDTNSSADDSNSISSTDSQIESTEKILVWAVQDLVDISDETVAQFNRTLKEKGFDYNVEFKVLDYENYQTELQKTDCDIAFSGFIGEDNENKPRKLIEAGYFECLDDYIKNSDWCNDINEKQWNAVRYDDKLYTIANENYVIEGTSIVFNLNKISKEEIEKFSGDITELNDIVNDPKSILYDLGDLSFANIYGYSYENGVLVSVDDKKAYNPFETQEVVTFLKAVNSWYNHGLVLDREELFEINLQAQQKGEEPYEWTACITGNAYIFDDYIDVYVYSTSKPISFTNYAAATGISANSKNKDAAYELISLIHTNSDLANLLIYGAGYQDINGIACDEDGTPINAFGKKYVFGINKNILAGGFEGSIEFESQKDLDKYFDEQVLESPANDIKLSCDTSKAITIFEENTVIWKSKDIDKDIATTLKASKEAGIDDILAELNAELGG